MKLNKNAEGPQQTGAVTPETDADEMYAPRNLTFGENLKLTLKIFAIAALVLGLLWGHSLSTSAK